MGPAHYKDSFALGRGVNSLVIEEFIFVGILRKRICLLLLQVFLMFSNKNWTAAATYSRTNKLY